MIEKKFQNEREKKNRQRNREKRMLVASCAAMCVVRACKMCFFSLLFFRRCRCCCRLFKGTQEAREENEARKQSEQKQNCNYKGKGSEYK